MRRGAPSCFLSELFLCFLGKGAEVESFFLGGRSMVSLSFTSQSDQRSRPFSLSFHPSTLFVSLVRSHQTRENSLFVPWKPKSNSRCRVQGRSERPQGEQQSENHLGLVSRRPGALGDAPGASKVGVVKAGACAVKDVKGEGSRRRIRRGGRRSRRRQHFVFFSFPFDQSRKIKRGSVRRFWSSSSRLSSLSSIFFSFFFQLTLFSRESVGEKLLEAPPLLRDSLLSHLQPSLRCAS